MSFISNKTADQFIEDGFADICVGVFKLRKEGKHQEAYDALGHVLKLLMQDRQDIVKTAKINV